MSQLEPEKAVSPRWLKWLLVLGLWTLLGVFDGAQSYLSYAFRGRPMPWARAIGFGLALWYAWAILSIFILRFIARNRFEHRNWPERLVLHMAAGIFFALVKLCMDYPIIEFFYCPDPGLTPFMDFYRMALASHFHPYVLIYWAIVGIAHANHYYRQYRERAQRATELESLLARARLHLLQSQIHPHFLLNTLNAIATLIPKDAELADRMIVRLGELLRASMHNLDGHEVPLREELGLAHAYLDIEQVRFGQSIEVEMAIDEATLDARVPFLILQPLVENSIRHGMGRHNLRGRVLIRSKLHGKMLRLCVEDDGPGGLNPKHFKERTGLGNTRARLTQLYGEDHRFELGCSRYGGLAVTIEIPFTAHAAAPSSPNLEVASAEAS